MVDHPIRAVAVRWLRAFTLTIAASAMIGCDGVVDPPEPAPTPPLFDARIAFTSTRAGSTHIYVASEDGSKVRLLTEGARPAWSPDGKRIAFERASPPTSKIHIVNVDGTGERLLTEGVTASWSPDGASLVFATTVGAQDGGIHVVAADGSGRKRLVSTEFQNPGRGDWLGWPAWSPDGKTIAFVHTSYDFGWRIFLMNADGTSLRPLTPAVPADQTPSWSPDGTMLAFGSFQRIGATTVDGTNSRLFDRALAFDPDWSPDGRSLVFNSFSSPVGDVFSSIGSRMRIYILDIATSAVRQLIPEAERPVLPNYWDKEAVWWRGR